MRRHGSGGGSKAHRLGPDQGWPIARCCASRGRAGRPVLSSVTGQEARSPGEGRGAHTPGPVAGRARRGVDCHQVRLGSFIRPDPSRALHARPWGRRPDQAPRAGCVSGGSIRWSHGGWVEPPPGDRRETSPRDTSRIGHPGAKAATRPGGKGALTYATTDPRLERTRTRPAGGPRRRQAGIRVMVRPGNARTRISPHTEV